VVGWVRSQARAFGLAALILLAACGGGGSASSPAAAAGSYDVKVVTSEVCEDGKDGWTITGHIVPKAAVNDGYYEGTGTYSGNMLQQGPLGTPQSSSRQLHAISGGAILTGTVIGSELKILGGLNEFPLQAFGGTVAAAGGQGVDHAHIGRMSPGERGNAGPGCDVTWNLTVTKKA
jgi:hypothetical protein